ncbi:c-type cytochrome [Paraburkholderia sp.]|uniref:c-type cytochrome n=1 Tax=Paraburkholderia sp. TaxID=1926495 RepID=UPI00238C36BA|nr:c-type cytochrome [Paraburkholderia sp.]MDE1182924.1 c-type cytochrome [Paraburkholderia sp.]
MKSMSFAAVALAGAVALGGPAHAETVTGPAGLALAQQQNCLSCHSVSRPFMGPALHDVAARYATNNGAATYLAHKIMDGSVGTWGPVPMPANTQLTPDQAASLANWILTLK